ncbi:MAG: DUF91 domain-containing protein [Chloroflexota bacterium]|nr:DUF91 domain-containing protein [Chloroflexota bacterium]
MLERTLEIALSRYPEMLDEGWTLVGQQLATGAGILDLLFKDHDGTLQLVEAKKGPRQWTPCRRSSATRGATRPRGATRCRGSSRTQCLRRSSTRRGESA